MNDLQQELDTLNYAMLTARNTYNILMIDEQEFNAIQGEGAYSELEASIKRAVTIRQLEALLRFLEVFDVPAIRQRLDDLLSSKPDKMDSFS